MKKNQKGVIKVRLSNERALKRRSVLILPTNNSMNVAQQWIEKFFEPSLTFDATNLAAFLRKSGGII